MFKSVPQAFCYEGQFALSHVGCRCSDRNLERHGAVQDGGRNFQQSDERDDRAVDCRSSLILPPYPENQGLPASWHLETPLGLEAVQADGKC